MGGVLYARVGDVWVPVSTGTAGAMGPPGPGAALIYNGTSYPPRGSIPPTTTVFWINHIDETLPDVGGDGAIVNVDVAFVFDPDAP